MMAATAISVTPATHPNIHHITAVHAAYVAMPSHFGSLRLLLVNRP